LSRFSVKLGLIALAGLALRLGYVLLFRRPKLPLGGDSVYYSGAANLLAQGHGFVEPLSLFTAHPQQSAGHPPLYLLWLTIPSLVWPDHNATQLVHMLWTCVLGTGTIAVIGLAGREIAGNRVGLIAAALAAIYPNIWVQDGMLLSESAAIFTVALILLLAYRFWNQPSVWRLVWLGAACGLGALARPELLLTVPFVILPLGLMVKQTPWRTKLTWVVAGGVAAAIVMAPWIGYNMTRFEEPVTFSTNAGGTMAAANCKSTYYGRIIGYKDYECAAEVWTAASRRHPNWEELDASQKDKAVRAEAMRYVDKHLDRLPVVVLARWGRILGVFEPFGEVKTNEVFLQQGQVVGYAIVWCFWIFGILAIVGLFLLRRRRVPIWPMLAFLVIVLISVGSTFAQTRYRTPMEVSVLLLAAVTLDAAYDKWRNRRASEPAPEVEPPDTEPARDTAIPVAP
jgi:4-amino-4-deoxy-L-arabinose transferase-like glycosyltransferase